MSSTVNVVSGGCACLYSTIQSHFAMRFAFVQTSPTTSVRNSFCKSSALSSHRRTLKTQQLQQHYRRTTVVCANAPETSGTESTVELSPAEKLAAEKKAEQERLRAAEKFVEVDEGNYLCINCGYLYEPSKGEMVCNVKPGTAFEDLDALFACPVCRSPKSKFKRKPKTIAGFASNQQYGFGGNSMTAGQKNLLIFGALAVFFFLLLSGYALD